MTATHISLIVLSLYVLTDLLFLRLLGLRHPRGAESNCAVETNDFEG